MQNSRYRSVAAAVSGIDNVLSQNISNFNELSVSVGAIQTNVAQGLIGVVRRFDIVGTPNVLSLTTAAGTTEARQVLTNLADGNLSANSSQAVTGGQLFATNSNIFNIANRTNLYLGSGNVNGGANSLPSFPVQGVSQTSVAAAFGSVDGYLTQHSNAISSLQTEYEIIDDLNRGTAGVVQRVAPAEEGAPATNQLVLTAIDGTAGEPGAAQKLSNLAAATLSSNSTDAVTGAQLFATNTNVTNIDDRVTSVEGDVNTIGDTITTIQGDVTNITNQVTSGTAGVVQRVAPEQANGPATNALVLTAINGTAAQPGAAQRLSNLAA
ncbi:hypothetical protein ME5_00619, partial [Bartonella tamiae Th239]